MKRNLLRAAALLALFLGNFAFSQEFPIDNMKPRDQRGINVFENPKDTISTFDHLRVRIGGAFAIQFQGLQHENKAVPDIVDQGKPSEYNRNQLYPLSNNFNLPTANLDLDVALYDGVAMHLRTFLSSRHHNETYVKGGYLQIDKLDFIKPGFAGSFMKYATIKIGQDEINYGDTHFRRSDNAAAIYNPFIGKYLMDPYATFIFGELYYRRAGFIGMVGVTNGRLNQTPTSGTSPGIYGKIGYDKQVTSDLRIRLTGSVYNIAATKRLDFYDGDRAGSRYYLVMENTKATASNNAESGQVTPDFDNKLTSIMINPFIKYKGLEFFGVFENASGRDFNTETKRRTYNQYAAELLYRFGGHENFYIGGRYNAVRGELSAENGGNKISVDRYNLGGGWFMTKNILIKGEYVNQKYDGYAGSSLGIGTTSTAPGYTVNPGYSIFDGGNFKGYVLEAVISF